MDRVAEIQEILEQSQSANCYPEKYSGFRRLEPEEHFRLWDEMWRLVQTNEKTKLVGS